MTEVPKIVYDRLRAALPERALPERTGPERAHPDADLLTAFAEQALSATERDGVLDHLALCGDCREVVALALPAADMVPPPIADETDGVRTTASRAGAPAPYKLSFAWPSLRWAALAAGIAVVAAVLLVRPGKLNQATLPSANREVATTVPPASGPQTASSSVPSPSIASSSTDQEAVLTETNEARPKSELRLSKKLKAGQAVTPSLQAGSGIHDAPASREATETVELSGANAAVEVAPSAEGSLTARNETPAIEKAKPAPQGIEAIEAEANEQQKTETAVVPGPAKPQARNMMSAAKLTSLASRTLAQNVTWAITGGVLQRSLDSGQSWQNALHADHPLLCYASQDKDVWTGGQAGTLFHSANRGVTWVQIQPSIKAEQLSSDITHIELRGDVPSPAEIVVSSSNGEVWSSADGGKTWEKK
jgi:hypothetical protein